MVARQDNSLLARNDFAPERRTTRFQADFSARTTRPTVGALTRTQAVFA